MLDARLKVRIVELILYFPVLLAGTRLEIGLDRSDHMGDKTQGPLQTLDNVLNKFNKFYT